MKWINNQLTLLIVRHLANAVGAWFVAKGFLTNDDTDKVYGAIAVLIAVGHSIWSKRADIVAEVKALMNGSKMPVVVAFTIPVLLMAGCKTYQVASATSGSGMNLNATVPIPYSGGQTILGLSLVAGYWKNANVLQPTATNGMGSPSVAIDIGTTGSAGASGTVSIAGTNGVAGINAADKEHLTLLTGQATRLATNSVSLTTGK